MAGRMFRGGLLVCLAFWSAASLAGEPPVVRSEAQLQAVLASGQPTPLDALTSYGKRAVLRSLHWNEGGRLDRIDFGVVGRELDGHQIAALLAFLDSESLLPMFSRDLDGKAVRLPEPSADIEEKLERFRRLSSDDAELRRTAVAGATPTGAAALRRHYARLFGDRLQPPALRRLPLGDLLPLFEAAVTMNFYHPGSVLQDQLHLHRELASRGVATQRWIDGRMLEALLSARRFDEARAFASDRPALVRRAIPVAADPLSPSFTGRSLYRYDSTSNTLTREAAPVPRGTQVIMVVSEGCQPSARALAALREDGELQARLRQANLLLVTDPSASIPLHFMSAWNAANPAMPMRATYNIEEWNAVIPTGVPEFFVLKDGKPVGQLRTGWPPEGNKAALLALLDAVGD